MFRSSVVILLLIIQSQSAWSAKACSDLIQAYNEYTQKVDGKIVKKFSVFDITDWSRNSRFQGLVLTEKAPAAVEIVLEVLANKKAKPLIVKTKKTTPFVQDAKYRRVDLDLEKQLGAAPAVTGSFVIKLFSAGQELCVDKRSIYDDGD